MLCIYVRPAFSRGVGGGGNGGEGGGDICCLNRACLSPWLDPDIIFRFCLATLLCLESLLPSTTVSDLNAKCLATLACLESLLRSTTVSNSCFLLLPNFVFSLSFFCCLLENTPVSCPVFRKKTNSC